MFTGIIKAIGEISSLTQESSILHFAVKVPSGFADALEKGGSVSVDGVCQTVVEVEENTIWFQAIPETLARTTLGKLTLGTRVNLERSAKIGDEIGGHLLSGHIYGTALLKRIQENVYRFQCQPDWMKYFFSKGFIAIDGISLTLVDVDKTQAEFTVHLIPETLKRTTLGRKRVGDLVNLELDAMTQATVETVAAMLANYTISEK